MDFYSLNFIKSENYAKMICAVLYLDTNGDINCLCEICDQQLHLSKLLNHIKDHFSETPYRCYKCENEFFEVDNFMEHQCYSTSLKVNTLEIVSVKEILDKNQDKQKKTEVQENHMDIVKNPKTEECKRLLVSNTSDSINDYTSMIKNETVSTHLIPQLSEVIAENLLSSTQLNESLIQDQKLKEKKSKNHIRKQSLKDTVLENCTGNDTGPTQSSNKAQENSCQKEICDICGGLYSKTYIREHHRQHQTMLSDEFECDICGKKYASIRVIKYHMRCHITNRPYECLICGFKFRIKSLLSRHEKIHQERKIECTICFRKFVNNTHLKKHLLVHTREKPYQCDLCGVFFRTTSARQTHRRLHTGEKPYKCKYCGKAFPQLAGLFCHVKIHEKYKKINSN